MTHETDGIVKVEFDAPGTARTVIDWRPHEDDTLTLAIDGVDVVGVTNEGVVGHWPTGDGETWIPIYPQEAVDAYEADQDALRYQVKRGN